MTIQPNHVISRRTFLRSGLTIVGAITMVGCTAAPPAAIQTPTPGAAVTAPAAAGQAQRGGSLVVATDRDPGQFNPGVTVLTGTHLVTGSLYNGLVQLDRQSNPQPDLAESWTTSPDGKTYTFKLASGVVWHDGQPFSSADVKISFEQVLLRYHPRSRAGLQPLLDGIDTPDASTVVLRLKHPYAPLMQRLDVVEAPILPGHLYDGTDVQTNPANVQPVGTGPFKLAEYRKGDAVHLVRNDHYFKPNLPYLDDLTFKVIPEANTATLAFERGEVDYLYSVAAPDVARLTAMPGVVVDSASVAPTNANGLTMLTFNLAKPPFDRVEVRQAFAYAIDRQQILDQARFGRGKVATGPIASGLAWAYDANVPHYPHDVAKANQVLDGAGLSRGQDGTRLKVDFPNATAFAREGEIIRQNLADVGINADLKQLEFNAATELVFVKHAFDIGVWGFSNGSDPDIGVPQAYLSSNIKPVPFSNVGYANPHVDDLFAQAAAASSRDERLRLYTDIQETLVREVPYVWLYENEGLRAYKGSLHDIGPWSGNPAERAWRDRAG